MTPQNTPKANTLKVSERYLYNGLEPICWITYYDFDGRLIMWDAFHCPTPPEVIADRKMRERWVPICFGLAIVVFFLLLAS